MNNLNVIVMVGMSGSGKSTVARINYSNYTIIEGDHYKTSKQIKRALEKALDAGLNCVIDATNVSVSRRKDIIDACRSKGAKAYAIVFHVSKEICWKRIKDREATAISEGRTIMHVPYVALNRQSGLYSEPTIQEGFEFILNL